MKRRNLMSLLVALWVPASLAGTVVCSGTVDKVAFHASDKLMLRLSSMDAGVFICSFSSVWSVSGTSYTTAPETCKAFHSMLLSAQALGTHINSMYFDGDQVPAACNQWGAWKSANIRYFSR